MQPLPSLGAECWVWSAGAGAGWLKAAHQLRREVPPVPSRCQSPSLLSPVPLDFPSLLESPTCVCVGGSGAPVPWAVAQKAAHCGVPSLELSKAL